MEAGFTDAEFEKAYQDFLNNKAIIHNTRARSDGESIWDTLTAAQGSFFASPEGAIVDDFVSTTLKKIIRD
jgi:hypothetical protein